MGSTRATARALEAEDGDYLVLVCRSSTDVDFRLVRSQDLPDDPEERLRSLVGASSGGDLLDVLTTALEIDNADAAAVRSALLARSEHDLVELLDSI